MMPAKTLNAYTEAAPCVAAITNPPTAGPSAAESWKLPLLHVTASASRGRGTSCGRNAPLAGHRKARATPLMKRNP